MGMQSCIGSGRVRVYLELPGRDRLLNRPLRPAVARGTSRLPRWARMASTPLMLAAIHSSLSTAALTCLAVAGGDICTTPRSVTTSTTFCVAFPAVSLTSDAPRSSAG